MLTHLTGPAHGLRRMESHRHDPDDHRSSCATETDGETTRNRSTWMIVGGLGAVVPLQRRGLLLSFALTDHVTPTPLNDEGGGEVYQEGDLTIRVADPRETGSDGVSLTGNFRLMVGLTLPLGRIGG